MPKNKELNVVGIIHARGGSKRIPLKNLKMLGGKPLVAWMIQAALKSKLLDRVIVSTDHKGIARVSKKYGAEVPFKRPARLAKDVPSELVTQHAIRYLEKKEGYLVDIAVTMQPTAPFCTAQDIDNCIELLLKTRADCVVSVKEASERPEWMFKKINGCRAVPFMHTVFKGKTGVSQCLPKLYICNGGIYVNRRGLIVDKGLMIGKDVRIYIMPRQRSIDIDEPVDFFFAEAIVKGLRLK